MHIHATKLASEAHINIGAHVSPASTGESGSIPQEELHPILSHVHSRAHCHRAADDKDWQLKPSTVQCARDLRSTKHEDFTGRCTTKCICQSHVIVGHSSI